MALLQQAERSRLLMSVPCLGSANCADVSGVSAINGRRMNLLGLGEMK